MGYLQMIQPLRTDIGDGGSYNLSFKRDIGGAQLYVTKRWRINWSCKICNR